MASGEPSEFERTLPFHPGVYIRRLFQRPEVASVLTGCDIAVLMAYAEHCDWPSGCNSYPSRGRIARETGRPMRTIQDSLAALEGWGFLVEAGTHRTPKGQPVTSYNLQLPCGPITAKRGKRLPMTEKRANRLKRKKNGESCLAFSASPTAPGPEGEKARRNLPESTAESAVQGTAKVAYDHSPLTGAQTNARKSLSSHLEEERSAAEPAVPSVGQRDKWVLADGREELGTVILGRLSREYLFEADGNGSGPCPRVRDILGELRPIEDDGRQGAKTAKSEARDA